MCGIFAYFDVQPIALETLVRMSISIAHRGPDDTGYCFFDILGNKRPMETRTLDDPTGSPLSPRVLVFGHRRLSIIDLTQAGHQPMCNENGRIWIIFNGEIYNHAELTEKLSAKGHLFKSRTDTEVILHAYEEWGIECLHQFNGMWAFAVWDEERKTLFCARDRFGIKPLYYFFSGKKFILASEIKAILQDPSVGRAPNHSRVYDYLADGHLDHTGETLFQNIYQLRRAQYMIVEARGANHISLTTHPYWDLEPQERQESHPHEGRFLELLEDSIRLHMRSDVPVGTCLSGGLDSSTIVCLAKRFFDSKTHHTFSSCFDDRRFDERKFIQQVVEATGARNHCVFPKAEDLFQEIQDLIWCQDEPFGSTSIFAQWNVFKLSKIHQVKVILDGQGADEILAGYHPYFGFYLGELLRTFQWRAFFHEYQTIRFLHGFSHVWLGSHLLASLAARRWPEVLGKQIRLTKQDWLRWDSFPFEKTVFPTKCKNVFFDKLYQSLMNLTLPALLHYEDRNSMAHSIEARVPFLDYRLVEFVFSLPMDQIILHGMTKAILREAMKGILPEDVRTRKDKMGFGTPEEVWFRTTLRHQIEEILRSKSFSQRGYVDAEKAHRAFKTHLEEKTNISQTIWRWVNLELWFNRFIDRSPLIASVRGHSNSNQGH